VPVAAHEAGGVGEQRGTVGRDDAVDGSHFRSFPLLLIERLCSLGKDSRIPAVKSLGLSLRPPGLLRRFAVVIPFGRVGVTPLRRREADGRGRRAAAAAGFPGWRPPWLAG